MRLAAIFLVCLMSMIASVGSLSAQSGPQEGSEQWRSQHQQKLTDLFKRLKASKVEADAKQLAGQIWALWHQSGDSDVDLLMRQARRTSKLGRHEAAIAIIDKALHLAPKYSEAWNLRATVLFYMGRDTESVIDIQRTLALEPRHFGALAGMTLINMRAKNWSGALKSLRLALKIHPFLNERNLVPRLEQLAKDQDL